MTDMTERVIADLQERSLRVMMFICENEDGQIVCIQYDLNGLVSHIERPVSNLSVNEGKGGRVFAPMFSLEAKALEQEDD